MVIYTTHDIRDAHIIAGRLAHEGIPHMIHTQPGASAMGLTLGGMAVHVLVKPQDYDFAEELLFPDDDPYLVDDTDYIQGLDQDIDDDE